MLSWRINGGCYISLPAITDALQHGTTSLDDVVERFRLANRRAAFAAGRISLEGMARADRDTLLEENLESLVDGLELQKLMVPVPGQEIRQATAYHLTAITPENLEQLREQDYCVGRLADKDVTVHSRAGGYKAFIGAKFAFGLVYHNLLIAVTAGDITEDSNFKIMQIQGVTNTQSQKGKENRHRFTSQGFHNGFQWRDTMVTCWEELAAKIGCPSIEVLSHQNNPWETVRLHGKAGYDDVAARMDFDPMPSGDWLKKLTSDYPR